MTFRSWVPLRALALAVLGLTAVTYSLTAELALIASQRADLTALRARSIVSEDAVKARYLVLTAELQALPLARPPGTIAAEIERLKATKGFSSCAATTSVAFGPITRQVCGQIATLTSEANTATRRLHLMEALKEAEHDFKSAPLAVKPDPAATVIASLLSVTLNSRTDVQTVAEWLSLVPVLALELGSALAVLLFTGTAPNRSTPGPPRMPPEDHPQTGASQLAHTEKISSTPSLGAPEAFPAVNHLSVAVLDHLKSVGGQLRGSQRGLAKALGVSTTELNRTLHSLSASGLVALTAKPTGTDLKLLV